MFCFEEPLIPHENKLTKEIEVPAARVVHAIGRARGELAVLLDRPPKKPTQVNLRQVNRGGGALRLLNEGAEPFEITNLVVDELVPPLAIAA